MRAIRNALITVAACLPLLIVAPYAIKTIFPVATANGQKVEVYDIKESSNGKVETYTETEDKGDEQSQNSVTHVEQH